MRALALLLLPQLLPACHCPVSWSACQDAMTSQLVFIGTVESIKPTTVRFQVKTVFRQEEKISQSVDVLNQSGDCGIPFQKGETYLVYATEDEKSDRWETSVCHRTARLFDAGDDLAYLYFLQNGGAHATRLEGFITSDIDQLHPDRFHYSGKVDSPVSDVTIELKSGGVTRSTVPDENGRFLFDGLSPGEYQLSALERKKLVSGPKPVHIQSGTCPVATLLVIVKSLPPWPIVPK